MKREFSNCDLKLNAADVAFNGGLNLNSRQIKEISTYLLLLAWKWGEGGKERERERKKERNVAVYLIYGKKRRDGTNE